MQIKNEHHEEIDELITLLMSGKLDESSFSTLGNYCSESEANRIHIRNLLEVWFSAGISKDTTFFNKNKAFELFKHRVENHNRQNKIITYSPWKIVFRIAVVILFLLIPFVSYWQGKNTVKQTFADISIEVPMRARNKLYLPEGTIVWLNSDSKITYSQGFGVDSRELTLEGEGYFEVTKNDAIPFKVYTTGLQLTVLGTKFNFRNYPEDEEITVVLMEGRIALQNDKSNYFLEPNEKMILNKITGEMSKSSTKAEYANVWTQDELFFDEELLADIAKKLMRSFNVKIEIEDSLREKRFYGSFKIQENTIDEVLLALSLTNQMSYRYENERYILY